MKRNGNKGGLNIQNILNYATVNYNIYYIEVIIFKCSIATIN